MSPNSLSTLQDLQDLQQKIATGPLLGELLAACQNRQGAIFVDMQPIAERVWAYVVPADGLGTEVHSLFELGQRAKRWIVLMELDKLRNLVLVRGYAQGRPAVACWTPFCGIEDLTISVRHELAQITNGWTRYRCSTGSRRPGYWSALEVADTSIRTLGFNSDLARFLDRAKTLDTRPAIQGVCTRMSVALRLAIESDRKVPMKIAAGPGRERRKKRAR